MRTDAMPPAQPPAPAERDDWLDAALRTTALDDDYIADDGFTARVMAALPAPAALPAWRRTALTGLWAVAGLSLAFALPGAASDLAFDAVRTLASHRVTLVELGAVALAFAAATWTAAAVALRRE